jgi:hypothetical protein
LAKKRFCRRWIIWSCSSRPCFLSALTFPAFSDARKSIPSPADRLLSFILRLLEAYHDLNDTPTLEFIDRHRSLSTLNQHPVPTIFPASYPFPFVASLPRKGDGSPSLGKGLNLLLGEIAAVLVSLVAVQPGKTLRGWLEESMEIDGQVSQLCPSFFALATAVADDSPPPFFSF